MRALFTYLRCKEKLLPDYLLQATHPSQNQKEPPSISRWAGPTTRVFCVINHGIAPCSTSTIHRISLFSMRYLTTIAMHYGLSRKGKAMMTCCLAAKAAFGDIPKWRSTDIVLPFRGESAPARKFQKENQPKKNKREGRVPLVPM